MHVLGGIGIAVMVLLGALYALGMPVPALPNEAQAIGYRFGRLLVVVVVPFLVAYPIAGRRKARNPNLFAGLFCGIALFVLFIHASGSLAAGSFQSETTDQKVARLMREAGGQPVRKSFFGEPKTDAMMRDFFKQIIAINKDYQAEMDKLDVGDVGKLNTPESFADPDSVTGALAQLRAAYELDARQEQRMRDVLENFRRSFDNLSSSDRDSMIKGFNEGLAKVMPTRQRAVTTEKAWVDAMDDVYGYARAHHDQFFLLDGHLKIAGDDVLQEFNNRIHALNAARQDFVQAKAAFDSLQGQTLQKNGLTRDQTGLH